METLEQLDKNLFLFLNGKNNSFFDLIFEFSSYVLTWIPLYLFLLFLVIRKYGKKFWVPLLSIVFIILITDRTSVLVKNSVQRYRPSHNIELNDKVHTLNGVKGGQFGFVSSHAANTFGLAVFLILLLKFKRKGYSLLLLTWAAFVSYGRIYEGLHYPADIAGGALIGIAAAIIIYYLQEKLFSLQPVSTSNHVHS